MAQAWSTRGLCALLVCAGAGLSIAICYPVTPAEQLEAAPDEESHPQGLPRTAAGHCQSADTPVDGKVVARLLGRLESRRSDAARCMALKQLAAHAAVGDAAIDVLEKYTRATYPQRVRVCAISALGYAVSPLAVGSLMELSRSIAGAFRDSVVLALASREEPAARAGLIAWASDRSSPLRDTAAIALAQIGAPEAVSLIEALLEDPGTRAHQLIRALGETGDPRALRVLQGLLDQHGSMFAEEVTAALGELSTPESTRVLLSMVEKGVGDRSLIYRALSRSSDAGAHQALLAAADLGNDSALSMLSSLEGLEVQAWMQRALDSGDSARLRAAAQYFTGHADAANVLSLSKLLRSDKLEQAQTALQVLGSIGGEAACDALEDLAGRPGPLQDQALSRLAQQPEAAERARALALSLLDQDDAPSNALSILAKDASPEARAALLRAARGGEEQSQRAIWLLSKRNDPETVSALSDIARGSKGPNSISALSALAEGGSAQAVDVLREALHSNDPSMRLAAVSRYGSLEAPDVEQAMLTASRDSENDVVTAAVNGLGELGAPAAVDQLAKIAGDPAGPVARDALTSLANASPERAVVVIDSLLQAEGSSGLRVALGAVSSLPEDASQRVLERALSSKDAALVSEALTQLQETGTDSGPYVAALDRVAHDTHLSSDMRDLARAMLIPSEEISIQ